MLFNTGSALLSHHLLDQCRDPRGGEAKIRKFRALSALAYDKLDHDYENAPSTRGYSVDSETTSVADESVGGGVSLLDRDDDDYVDYAQSDRNYGRTNSGSESGIFDDMNKMNTDGEKEGLLLWAKSLFPNTSSSPAPEGFETPSEPIRFDNKAGYANKMQSGPQMMTDWDHAQLTKNYNQSFECPFHSCKYVL